MIYKVCAVIITLCVICVTLVTTVLLFPVGEESYLSDCYEPSSIAVLPIYGDIAWGVSDTGNSVYGADVALALRELKEWGDFAGIVLDIDSPGGYPVASARIADLVVGTDLPTAAAIGDMGLSGGYWIAASTDRIFIDPLSAVGSIGVTMSYVSENAANETAGYKYESLSTGAFKDTGDPAKELTEEEREYIMAELKYTHEKFVERVAIDRSLSVDTVNQLADGKWYWGEAAIENGLADEFGGIQEAVEYIRTQTGVDSPVCYLPIL